MSPRAFVVAAAIAVVAVGAATTAFAAGSASYPDAAGDANGGPDVRNVTLSHDDTGRVRIAVTLEALSLGTDTSVAFFIDGDRNASTGLDGTDEAFLVLLADLKFAYLRWNGSDLEVAQSQGARLEIRDQTITLDVHPDDVGGTDGFDVWIVAMLGSGSDRRGDRAPDAGSWSYLFQNAAPPPPPAPSSPAPPSPAPTPTRITAITVPTAAFLPKAGRRLTLRPSVKLSDGRVVKPRSAVCTARLAGIPLRGSGTGGCTWTFPTSAQGKRLTVDVSVSYGDARRKQRLSRTIA